MEQLGTQALAGVVLGSGGWIPTSERQTCAALFRKGSDALVVDAGTGLQRLLEQPELVAGAENIHVVLTHFHLDHVVGLAYLPALPFARPPIVWGAGPLLAGTSTRGLLERLLAPPLFSVALAELVRDIREIDGDAFSAGAIDVSVRVQERHSERTLALRIGDLVAYCTDTAPDPGNVELAAGCHALLHEAWYAADTSDDETHTAAGDAARIAREAGVERLVLVHVNPVRGSDEELREHARRHFPAVEVATDLAPVPLP